MEGDEEQWGTGRVGKEELGTKGWGIEREGWKERLEREGWKERLEREG